MTRLQMERPRPVPCAFPCVAKTSNNCRSEGEHSPASRLIARRDPAVMVLDDPLADGKAQTGAMRFPVRGEDFEQLPSYLWRDAPAPILDLGDHLRFGYLDAQDDLAPLRHRIGCVMHQIAKNAAQAFRVDE